MQSIRLGVLLAAPLAVAACGSSAREAAVPDAATPRDSPAESATVVIEDTSFATVPESAWVSIAGPTLVAFYPIVSNDALEADEGLSTALDDLSYHIGSAMDSLTEAGYSVAYRGGDTLWLRTRSARIRVVRAADSATVGYVFADTLGRLVTIYGVRSNIDLVEYAHAFRRTGTLQPR